MPPLRPRSRFPTSTASGNWCCTSKSGMPPRFAAWPGKSRSPRAQTIFHPAQADRSAWRKTIAQANALHAKLVKTVAALPESRLLERVPGKKYDIYFMLHGLRSMSFTTRDRSRF